MWGRGLKGPRPGTAPPSLPPAVYPKDKVRHPNLVSLWRGGGL